MENLPEKTCTIEKLIRSPRLVTASISGLKTEQRRDGVYAHPGETFELNGVKFVMTALFRQTLKDMTDADAIAEGYSDLQSYKDVILKMHQGMEWNENGLVWVHQYKRIESVTI